VLIDVARRLKGLLRDVDTVARFGGDGVRGGVRVAAGGEGVVLEQRIDESLEQR